MALPFFNAYRGSIGRFFQGDPTLVGYWQLDGNSLDNSGNGNNGTDTAVTYSPVYSRFSCGQGAYFNGTSSYIDVGNANTKGFPLGTSPRTIAAWFNTDVLRGASLENIVGWGTTSSNGYLFFASIYNNRFYFWGHNADVPGVTILSTKTWYLGVITYNGTTVKVYLNGVLESSRTPSLNTQNSNVYIGQAVGTNCPNPFSGNIDEVAVFSRALSPAEISQYYQWATSQPRKTYYEVGGLLVPNTRRRLLLTR